MKKRILSIVLVLTMLLSVLNITSVTAFAATPTGIPLTSSTQELSGNYYLNGNLTMSAILWLKSGSATIDLNGYVLTLKQGSYGIGVDDGTLTIKDSNPTATHKFTSSTTDAWTWNESSGDRTVSGGVITGALRGSITPVNGAAIFINAGSVVMEGGNIVGNR